MTLITEFFNTIFCLLGLGFIVFLIVALMSPFESMKWWAGWAEHGLDPEPETIEPPEPLPDARTDTDYNAVYLTGIGGFGGDYLADREIEFLNRLDKKLGGNVVIVRDVFPFSVSNNPLGGERMLKRMWHWVHARQLENPMHLSTFIIVIRNMLQVAVSGDSRYGPLNNFGVAREVAHSLMKHGYQIGSGKPITLVGYSGGGQISIGITRYLKKAFQAPVQIVSLGGVMSDDPGFDEVDHLYQVIGGKDFFPGAGVKLYPRRWSIVPYRFSHWNKIKRDGRVIDINPGDEVYHVGGEDYFSEDGKLPNGQTFMDKTLEIVFDVVTGNTEKYKNGNKE
jgi:hypothetical protein